MRKSLAIKTCLYFISFCFWGNGPLILAQENPSFQKISTKEGLSQSSVIDMIQDKDGFLWFGTRDGLNKYDGNRFKTYYYRFENQESLSNNWITSLLQDSQGGIWAGTRNGLNYHDSEKDVFLRLTESQQGHDLGKQEIWDMVSEDGAHIWVATNSGLYLLNVKTKETQRLIYEKGNDNSLSSNSVRGLLRDGEENLWISTDQGIDRYNLKNKKLEHFEYPETHLEDLRVSNKISLFQDSRGRIWLGFENGLAVFDLRSRAFKFYQKTLITNNVRSIDEDNQGYLWVGTYDGLYQVNLINEEVRKYEHNEADDTSLSHNSVYSVLKDSKGDLWIGTWAGGVNLLSLSSNAFHKLTAGYDNTKLNYGVVSSIVDTPDHLWVGTEGGGLNLYDKKKKTFSYHTHQESNPNSLGDNNIKAMIKDSRGTFWIGTHGGGLYLLDPKKRPYQFKKHTSISWNNTSVSDNRITCLLEDSQGNIWIGTDGGEINLYEYNERSFTKVDDEKRLLGSSILVFSKTNYSDSLLIGSEKGLVKISITTKEMNAINFYGTTTDTDVPMTVSSLYSDENILWIGTRGNGLHRYDPVTNKSTVYNTANGLSNDVVYAILPDRHNHLWVSTNKGLNRLDRNTGTIKSYDVADGLSENEFNYGAVVQDQNRRLYFGSTNGITFFEPGDIKENTFIPPVAITAFKVRHQLHTNMQGHAEKITLKHNQNDFGFDFVALSYYQPGKNQYAYKLEGLDEDWNYVGNRKTANYTNIEPGEYFFKVKAANNDGYWNEEPVSIQLKIRPPIWRTWWVSLLYFLAIICVVFMVRRYLALKAKQRDELKQERIEKERIKKVNQLKLKLFTNISHDFRTPLTLIAGPLQRLIQEKRGGAYVQDQLRGMYRNTSVLLQLINELLDFRKSEVGQWRLQAYENDIVAFLREIKLCFEDLAKQRNIDYRLREPKKVPVKVWFDPNEMKKVVFNLLSNAFKFTEDHGSITLAVILIPSSGKDGEQQVKLEFTNTGKGIPKEEILNIFDRYFQLGKSRDDGRMSGFGIGLSLSKNIIERHHGNISVKSMEGKETKFTILLPLGKDHLNKEEILTQDFSDEKIEFSKDEVAHLEVENFLRKKNYAQGKISLDDALPNILLVEDNEELRDFIKNILRDNFNIFEADNGEEALVMAKEYSMDLIISDVMMPRMDGIALSQAMKRDIKTSHVPIILLTARTSSKAQKIGYETGADVYLTKPFNADILQMQIGNMLNSRKKLVEKFKKDVILEPKEFANNVSVDEAFLKKAIDIVEENVSNPQFNVNFFVSKMYMSRSVLYRKLKALTGQSISEFVRMIKLKKAAQLLEQTKHGVADIAYQVGFNDLKYFRTCFKKVFKKSPSQYRKLLHWESEKELQNLSS
ncbi:MAG: response regulator [Flavobacteriaceae bacterium]|nr:response regulator [Flavobacteriaceae bacterium]